MNSFWNVLVTIIIIPDYCICKIQVFIPSISTLRMCASCSRITEKLWTDFYAIFRKEIIDKISVMQVTITMLY